MDIYRLYSMSIADNDGATTAPAPAVGAMAALTINIESDIGDRKKRHQSSSPVIDDEDRIGRGQRKFAREESLQPEKEDMTELSSEGSTNFIISDNDSPTRQFTSTEKRTPGLNDSLYEKLLNLKDKVRDSKTANLASRATLFMSPLIKTAFNSDLSQMGVDKDQNNSLPMTDSPSKEEDHNYSFENNLFLRAMSLSIDSMQGSLNRNTGSIDRNSASIDGILERVTHADKSVGLLEQRVEVTERSNLETSKLIHETKSYVDIKINQLKTAIPSTLAVIENDFDDKIKSQTEFFKSEIELKNCSQDRVNNLEKSFHDHLARLEQETKDQFAGFNARVEKLVTDMELGARERSENKEEFAKLKDSMNSLLSGYSKSNQSSEIDALKN